MKKVYIVLTYTGTWLAKIVKFYTKKEYSHVSISLDENLDEMYSFGRLNPYIPFIGGFVQESPKYGTFKRFNKTKSVIYSLEVSDDTYEKIKKSIEEISENRKSYSFNVIGLFIVPLGKKRRKERCFYCAEFVKYVLDNTLLEFDLPEIIKPDDFSKIEECKEIYKGMLNQYKM